MTKSKSAGTHREAHLLQVQKVVKKKTQGKKYMSCFSIFLAYRQS